MWRELIERLDAEATFQTFHPPATLEQLQAVESCLGVALPAELRDLLLETTGNQRRRGRVRNWLGVGG